MRTDEIRSRELASLYETIALARHKISFPRLTDPDAIRLRRLAAESLDRVLDEIRPPQGETRR